MQKVDRIHKLIWLYIFIQYRCIDKSFLLIKGIVNLW